jgi:hypothetical protein
VTERGIVASGILRTGEPYEDQHWDDASRTAWYVDVIWNRVVSIDDRLPLETLLTEVPSHDWNHVYASGQVVESGSAEQLEELWQRHLSALDEVWSIAPGETTTRQDIRRRFGGATQGGIQPSATSANVLLFSDPTAGK